MWKTVEKGPGSQRKMSKNRIFSKNPQWKISKMMDFTSRKSIKQISEKIESNSSVNNK